MRKFLTIMWVLVMSIGQLAAQSKRVAGKVTATDGSPVPNVSVTIKGSSTGTTTDADGAYALQVPPSASTLVFSSVGMVPLEITIGNKTTINAELKTTDQEMQEVVVVGYGTQKKSDVTASIVTIKGSAIADKPVQSFDAALGGRAAGVQITIPNGVLNNPPVFKIRGTNSINLSSYPLIVVDGVPTYTGDISGSLSASNALSSINPNDIESMEVLKDAAGTAIYGSRAANGVVLITTKKGKKGKAKVVYDGWAGVTKPYRLWDMLDADQYMLIKNEGLASLNAAPRYLPTNDANGNQINTNWYDYAYQDGFSYNHALNISGGTDATTYYFSAGYTNQEGIILKNTFDRKTLRFNVDHKVNNAVSIGLNATYANELNKSAANSGSLPGSGFASAGLARLALALPPNVSPYNNDGSYNVSGNAIGRMNNTENITFYNPAPILDLNYSNTENNRIQGNIYLQIKPIKDVTLRSVYGIDYLNTDNKQFNNPIAGDGQTSNGSAFSNINKNKRWVWTTTAQYDKVLAEKHTIGFLAGTEQQRTSNEGFGLSRNTLSDRFYEVIQGGWTINNTSGLSLGQNYLWSAFGRLNYNFNKKYFVSGNFRRDGYSAFADGAKYGNFYSFAGGWDIAQENFWANNVISGVVNSFKLRGSYGTVGNISGIGDFASYNFYGASLYNGNPTLHFSQAGNPALTWETSKKLDIGLNFGLFDDRITGEVGWYRNDIDGLILAVPQSPSTGMPNSPLANVGTMWNRGLEVTLNANIIRSKDFTWTSSFNFTTNENRVTSLAPGVDNIITSTSGLETVSITLPGYSVGYIYVVPTAGVNPDNGRRIFINSAGEQLQYNHAGPAGSRYTYVSDGTVAPDINPGRDQKPMFNSVPKYFGGFDNTFRYKAFDLNILLTYQGGFYVYNGTQATIRDQRFWNSSTDVLNRWQKPGDVTNIPKLVYGDNVSNGSANPISDNVQKGDFIKLRNINLGYTLSPVIASRLGISSARFYVSGQNLAILTSYEGPDPEVSSNGQGNLNQGIDRNSVANGRILTFGLNIGF